MLLAALLAAPLAVTLSIHAVPDQTRAAPQAVVNSTRSETPAEHDLRMEWWRDARFGMFIHWGLYAVPAGEWNGKPVQGAGEWILNGAQIKPEDYEPLQKQFNPTKFNAKQWVDIAKNAGMKYIVITSKHHDGFGLWDSKLTDWDVMNTPFHRDILKELAAACKDAGIRLCFYHSIMDWHHPDYLPRRGWDTRSADSADFDRYREYMKGQLTELLSGDYGDIGVVWFDGEWESTWNHEFGKDLDDHVRSLDANIIVNNRVDVGRHGMANPQGDAFRGDFGTPEQEIPATGYRNADGTTVDWETCMTMNNTWGFHKFDTDWKSAATMTHMLCDIASKGGNFLLNVGPTASGEIPPESVERLAAMGAWLAKNGESIYGTTASLFPDLAWGRSTTRTSPSGTTLYFQVFDWPTSGRLTIPGLMNEPKSARLLSTGSTLQAKRAGADVVIDVPPSAPDAVASVVALEVSGAPQIVQAAQLRPQPCDFVEAIQVSSAPVPDGVVVRYTTDGRDPTSESAVLGAIALRHSSTVKARAFMGDTPVGAVATSKYRKVNPWTSPETKENRYVGKYFEWAVVDGTFASIDDVGAALPDVLSRNPPKGVAIPDGMTDHFGLYFGGWINVKLEGMYRFKLGSDDGSLLAIDGRVVVDNDGAHSFTLKEGEAPLARGHHRLELWYFERDGQNALSLEWAAPGGAFVPFTGREFVTRDPASRTR